MGISIKLPKKNPDQPKKSIKFDTKKLPQLILTIALVLGFILLCFSTYYLVYDINRNKNAIKTDATVKKVQFVGESYMLDITYVVDNKIYESSIVYEGDSVTMNDKISIKYNGNNPYDIITTNHNKEIIICTPISLILIIGSFIYLSIQKKKAKRLQKLKETGIVIYADIEGIFVNNNAKKKRGKLPYHIKAIYLNPQDQQQYTYISEDYYEDLLMLTSSKTITKVPIYINPKNTKDYYMDLVYILPEEKNEQK